jgi:hypothetical protein
MQTVILKIGIQECAQEREDHEIRRNQIYASAWLYRRRFYRGNRSRQ